MSYPHDVEIWESQIGRWSEQADVITKRIESTQVMFSAGAIGEHQFETELKALEADRLVYLHAMEEAGSRLRARQNLALR